MCHFDIVLDFVQIREELRANGIDVYPQKEFDEDAEDRLINDKIRVSSHGWKARSAVTLQVLIQAFLLFVPKCLRLWKHKRLIVNLFKQRETTAAWPEKKSLGKWLT